MKVLITGGAGFLGLHTANTYASENHQVTLLDIAEYNKEEYRGANIRFIVNDVRNKELMEELAEEHDVIIHCAAALPLWKPAEIFSTNVEGTRTVLESALSHGRKRTVFISSTAVYGIPEKHPIVEDDPLIGVGAYGKSKIEAEKICEEYREKGLVVPILRPKTFIGPERLGVFQILFDWVESGKRIPIIGNGKNRYQLLDVRDLVDSIKLVASGPEELVNDTYNLGAEEFGTVEEDVGALCDYAGSGARVMKTNATLVKFCLRLFEKMKLSPLYEWVYGTADKDSFVSSEKIMKKLGWKPKWSNAESLIDSYKWYLEHKDELPQEPGVTHRVAWKQGILALFKKLL